MPADKTHKGPDATKCKVDKSAVPFHVNVPGKCISTGSTGCITISFIRCLGLKCAKWENADREPIEKVSQLLQDGSK